MNSARHCGIPRGKRGSSKVSQSSDVTGTNVSHLNTAELRLRTLDVPLGVTIAPPANAGSLQLLQFVTQDSQTSDADGGEGQRKTSSHLKRACVTLQETWENLREGEKAKSSEPSKRLALVSAAGPERTRLISLDGESSPPFSYLLARDSQSPSCNFLALEEGSLSLSQLPAQDSSKLCTHAVGNRQRRTTVGRDCARCAPQQENPKKTKNSGKKVREKSEKAGILATESAASAVGQDGHKRPELRVIDQHLSQQNTLDRGPPRFSQLLAQDSESSNPLDTLDPDTPMQTYHVPSALKELFKQSRPEVPAPSKKSKKSESVQTDPSCREDNVRTKIMACMLDPSFHDLLSEVEKVWRELEVSRSDEGQLAEAVMRNFKMKAATNASPSTGK
ncbi:hypothetical protein R1flu_014545 [Riccia fluitans]|uniref:Uncharacterized protein n=1 Tax=Riccia fluitans TaxID=41844 RepID=A0ABD1YJS4_9MARC